MFPLIAAIVAGVAILDALIDDDNDSGTERESPAPRPPGGDYAFDHRQVNGSWRAYIVRQPSYRGRSESLHDTHRLRDGSRLFVCWTRPVLTRKDSVAVARLWRKKTDDYIRCGTSF